MTISATYRAMNAQLHRDRPDYGAGGHKHGPEVARMLEQNGWWRVLDYGCGKGTLKQYLQENVRPIPTVFEYDPAIPGKDGAALPVNVDLICCTDVLEHVEPEKLDGVLLDTGGLFPPRAVYLQIALRRDRTKALPDGSNPHKIVKPWEWWEKRLIEAWPRLKTIEVLDHAQGHHVKALIRF